MGDYIILKGVNVSGMMAIPSKSGMAELEEKVNLMIRQGYVPIGGVCVTDTIADRAYYQAMVKKEILN